MTRYAECSSFHIGDLGNRELLNWMTDYIEDNRGLEENVSYDYVLERVGAAWQALRNSNLLR